MYDVRILPFLGVTLERLWIAGHLWSLLILDWPQKILNSNLHAYLYANFNFRISELHFTYRHNTYQETKECFRNDISFLKTITKNMMNDR